MRVEFDFNKEDLINFNMHYFDTSNLIKKSLLKSRIMGTLIFIIVPFILRNSRLDIPNIVWFVTFWGIAILWFMFLPRISKNKFRNAVSQTATENKDNKYMWGKKIVELREDSIMVKGEAQETFTDYSSIINVVSTENAVYLYNSTASAIIVPSKAFKSSSEKEDFINLAKAKITVKEEAPKNLFEKITNL